MRYDESATAFEDPDLESATIMYADGSQIGPAVALTLIGNLCK
jgi:hypothetical protein